MHRDLRAVNHKNDRQVTYSIAVTTFSNLDNIWGMREYKIYSVLAEVQLFLILSLMILCMPSSELLRCKECGQLFDTVESLREHMKSERDEMENRVKGFSDG